jgi:hypothetical protein
MEVEGGSWQVAAAGTRKQRTPKRTPKKRSPSKDNQGSRTPEWHKLCLDHQLCFRCGYKHPVRDCKMKREEAQPSTYPPGLTAKQLAAAENKE